MAFDPDEFLGAKAPAAPAGGGFDPDEFLGAPAESGGDKAKRLIGESLANINAKNAPIVTSADSLLRTPGLSGVVQGATGGFADEVGGFARALSASRKNEREGGYSAIKKDVAREVTAARDQFAKEQAADPRAFMLGTVAGGAATSFAPGLGVLGAAKGTVGAAGLVGRAAAQGAVTGAGFSDANNVRELAAGAVTGAALGAGTAGVLGGAGKTLGVGSKWLAKGAQRREDMRLIQAVTNGAKPTSKQLVARHAEDVAKQLRAEGWTPRMLAKADKALDTVLDTTMDAGKKIGKAYETIDEAGALGIRPKGFTREIDSMMREIGANPALTGQRRALSGLKKQIQKDFGKTGYVSLERAHDFASALGKGAFNGAKALSEQEAKVFGRQIAGRLNGVLKDRVAAIAALGDNVAETSALSARPAFSGAVKAGKAAADLPVLNKRFGLLKDVERVVKERANRNMLADLAPTSINGLKNIATNPVSAGAAYLFDPSEEKTFGTLALAFQAARLGVRGMDKAVVRAAAANAPRSAVVNAAIKLGASKTMAEKYADALKASPTQSLQPAFAENDATSGATQGR